MIRNLFFLLKVTTNCKASPFSPFKCIRSFVLEKEGAIQPLSHRLFHAKQPTHKSLFISFVSHPRPSFNRSQSSATCLSFIGYSSPCVVQPSIAVNELLFSFSLSLLLTFFTAVLGKVGID